MHEALAPTAPLTSAGRHYSTAVYWELSRGRHQVYIHSCTMYIPSIATADHRYHTNHRCFYDRTRRYGVRTVAFLLPKTAPHTSIALYPSEHAAIATYLSRRRPGFRYTLRLKICKIPTLHMDVLIETQKHCSQKTSPTYFAPTCVKDAYIEGTIRLSDPDHDSQRISVQIHLANRMTLGVSSVSRIHFGFGFIVNPDPDPITE